MGDVMTIQKLGSISEKSTAGCGQCDANLDQEVTAVMLAG